MRFSLFKLLIVSSYFLSLLFIISCNVNVSVKTSEATSSDASMITDVEFEKIKSQLGPLSFTVKKVESDCLNGQCNVQATFSLYSIDGVRVDPKVSEQSKTTVSFDKTGSTEDNSHLCPLNNKDVVLNMTLNYGGNVISALDRSVLVGARVDDKTLMVGVSDTTLGYNFYNVDTIVTEIKCSGAKSLKVQDLCEDTNLDDAILRRCWTTVGMDTSCPYDNIYSNNEYPVSCRVDKSSPVSKDNKDNKDNDTSKITKKDYENMKSRLGPISLQVKKNKCLKGKYCNIAATFSLYSVDGVKVDSKVAEESKTTVSFNIDDLTDENARICPLDGKSVVLNMSFNVGGVSSVRASDRTHLVGGRVDDNSIMIGMSYKNQDYNFYNVSDIITEVSCPGAKKLTIKDLCEDTNLDDATLRRCWTIPGMDTSCPSNNVYNNHEYPVTCR